MMGWDVGQDRPRLTEVEPSQADEWAIEAEALLERVRWCRVDEVQAIDSERDLALQVMFAPIRLARRLNAPLWSDDRAIRILARNEGVASFGSGSVLRILRATGQLDEPALANAFISLMSHSVVDFPVPAPWVLQLAAAEEWRGEHACLVLSRPSFWRRPETALEVYHRGLEESARRDPAYVTSWSLAAPLGAARARIPAQQLETIATLMLSGLAALGLASIFLPPLLAGARSAAQLLELDDPLETAARMLSRLMRQQFGEATGTKVFARTISELEAGDRTAAFGILVQNKQ
jgi:hypothetical protein